MISAPMEAAIETREARYGLSSSLPLRRKTRPPTF